MSGFVRECAPLQRNGALTPLPSGSYQQTVRNIQLQNGSDCVYLVAECKKINGTWVFTAGGLGAPPRARPAASSSRS